MLSTTTTTTAAVLHYGVYPVITATTEDSANN